MSESSSRLITPSSLVEGPGSAAEVLGTLLTRVREVRPPFFAEMEAASIDEAVVYKSISIPVPAQFRRNDETVDAPIGALPGEAAALAVWCLILHHHIGPGEIVIARVVGALAGETVATSTSAIIPAEIGLDVEASFSDLCRQVQVSILESESRWRTAAQPQAFGRGLWPILFEYCGSVTPARELSAGQRSALKLVVSETPRGTEWILEYAPSLLPPDYAQCLADQLSIALQRLSDSPAQRLDSLSLLSQREYRRLVLELNSTSLNVPPQLRCFHELFEVKATENPTAPAIQWARQTFTYHDVDRLANEIAYKLLAIVGRRPTRVGLCIHRSPAMLIALLGILKSGGCYVPLDAKLPELRIRSILDGSQIDCVIVDDMTSRKIDKNHFRSIVLNSDLSCLSGNVSEKPSIKILPDDPAYVMFTSGSTGTPKGVIIRQRGLTNYVQWSNDYYRMSAATHALVHTSIGFDATITSALSPLAVGGRVQLLDDTNELDALTDALASDETINLVKITPAHLDLLLAAGPDHGLKDREIVFVIGGDALHRSTVLAWRRRAPMARLINEYGPTETVVGCMVFEVADGSYGGELVPIGRPIANTKIYILDPHRRPVPVGVVGELYIGGAGVAAGYFADESLTGQKFVQNPFSSTSDTLYRTGDLARFRPDGVIDFLGRQDHQVKIRGHRIELAEIEALIKSYPQVIDAAAVIQDHPQLGRAIVAHVTANGPARPSEKDLRQFVAERAPSAMVPAAFCFHDSFPMTVNGKIDRARLKQLAADCFLPQEPREDQSPLSPTETIVAELWRKVLHRQWIGIDDDFFSAGGNSLLSAQATFQLRKAFGIGIPIRLIHEARTIRAIAKTIDREVVDLSVSAEHAQIEKDIDLELDFISGRPGLGSNCQSRQMLLTGATGFVGANLLREMLADADRFPKIACLVRCNNPSDGMSRVAAALARYDAWHDAFLSRISIIPGDVSVPLLGLSRHDYDQLSDDVRAVYHSAANVDLGLPYAALRDANVIGTHEMLRFAAWRGIKPLHYVSTVSVFDSPHYFDGRVIREDAEPEHYRDLFVGYAQTKWVAETLVRRATKCGLPTTIYRLATVAGHSGLGVWNPGDFLTRAIKGCIELGAWPTLDAQLTLVPVDFVAKAIVTISGSPDALGGVYHISNASRVSSNDLFEALEARAGHLVRLDYDAWRRLLLDTCASGTSNALAPVADLFERTVTRTHKSVPEFLVSEFAPRYDTTGADRYLPAGTKCPVVTIGIMDRYLSFLTESDFIPRPHPEFAAN